MSDQVKVPLAIKYRPVTIETVVLDPSYKEKLQEYYNDPNTMPASILLVGTVGTGKTTVATALQRRVKKHIYIKGSVDNSINIVRERIEPFCKLSPNERKIVRIEEADRLSNAAQLALRNIIEDYSSYPNVTFIMTANHLWKLHDALRSRSVIFYFETPPKELIFERLDYIIKQENLNFVGSEEVYKKFIYTLINKFYPKIRDMINALEGCIVGNTIQPTKLSITGDYNKQLCDMVLAFNNINLNMLNELLTKDIDFFDIYNTLIQEYTENGDVERAMVLVKRLKNLDNIASPEIDFLEYLYQYHKVVA